MQSSNGGLNHRQDWEQDGTLLDVFGDVVRIFHCKSKNGVSTNVLSKSNHTRGGGYNRIKCTEYSKDKVMVHLRKDSVLCKSSFKIFSKQVFECQGVRAVDPHRIQVLNRYRTPRPP
jgi:hypothetical protein